MQLNRSMCFSTLCSEKRVRRLCAFTEDYNTPGQKLFERLGMRREKVFKKFLSYVNDAGGKSDL